MTEEYTPPYTSTPLAPGADVPPVVGYSTGASDATGTSGSTGGSDGGTVDVAKGQASEVGQGAVQAGQHVAGVAKDQAANVGAEAGRQAKDLLSQATSEVGQQAGQQQQRLAQGIRSLSDELHSMASKSDQSGPATDLVRQGAQRSKDIASWLEQRDPSSLLDEVKTFARQRPGTFLLLAAGAGLVAGRLTRGLKEAASDQSSSSQPSDVYSGQYSGGTQYGAGTQYSGGAQYGSVGTGAGFETVAVEEVDVVRPYASSEDGPTGFPTRGTL